MAKIHRQVYYLLMWALAVTCVMLPNSLQVFSALTLGLASVFAMLIAKHERALVYLMGFWLITSIVTLLYILVGLHNGASLESVYQVSLVYIIFPLAWLLCLNCLVDKVSLNFIVKCLIICGLISCL
ncbi:MAG: hypothetical protein KUG71_10400, partial [Porticoccaceae bacterium]|nr:hypothetical protein [Porticoccaceae bacterium]